MPDCFHDVQVWFIRHNEPVAQGSGLQIIDKEERGRVVVQESLELAGSLLHLIPGCRGSQCIKRSVNGGVSRDSVGLIRTPEGVQT